MAEKLTNDLFLRQFRNGMGIFANRSFGLFDTIMEFTGSLFTREQLPVPYGKAKDHYVQIGKHIYIWVHPEN